MNLAFLFSEYFAYNGITCFRGDSNEAIKSISIPKYFYDVAIVDPVYGIDGNSHRRNHSRSKAAKATDYHKAIWDQQPPNEQYFKHLERVSKNQIIWGANHYGDRFCKGWEKPPRRHEFDQFIKENPKGWIIWDKCNGKSTYSDCELAWTSFDIPSYVFPFMWSGMMQGKSMIQGRIMQGNKKKNEKRIHPTQKPVQLYKFLLDKYTVEFDKILDTHLGSGSIAIAALEMARRLTAFEIEDKYYQDAKERFIDFTKTWYQNQKQKSLF